MYFFQIELTACLHRKGSLACLSRKRGVGEGRNREGRVSQGLMVVVGGGVSQWTVDSEF